MSDQVPIIARVDTLVIGGGSGAVSLALAAAKGGASVYLVAPRAYLGDDIAARFDYWPRRDDEFACELATNIFPQGPDPTATPPLPLHVKRTLEQALVARDVKLVLNSHPAGVLRDAGGRCCGAIIANRAGRQAIVASAVIDASERGLLARQAGLAFTPPPGGLQRVHHVTVGGEGELEGLPCEQLPPFVAPVKDGTRMLAARRYELQVDLGDGSWGGVATAYADAVRRCWRPGVFQHSECLAFDWSDHVEGKSSLDGWPGCKDFPLEALQVEENLWVFGPAAPIGRSTASRLTRPAHMMAVGERLGTAIARAPRRTPAAPLAVHCAAAERVNDGEVRTLLHGLRETDVPGDTVAAEANLLPRIAAYDVVVVGGGTGGSPAAIGAARAGASTLLCEQLPILGGVGTAGQISSYYYGNNVGFTDEVDAGVRALETDPSVYAKRKAWTPAAKAAWFLDEARQTGAAVWFATTCCGTWVAGGRVRGVVVAGPYGYGLVAAKAVVDATGSADVAAAAAAETVGIGADHVAVQGTGLAAIIPDRRGNNSDHNFSDDTDLLDATAFLVSTKQKMAGQYDLGQLVDSRERRQIVGDVTLGPVDFLAGRRFPDSICLHSSNFDTHGFTVHPLFKVKPPDKDRQWVYVPYRCLLPRGLDGVLVTGLGVSAHRDALPVIRMQGDVQNQGYAAGRAAAMAAEAGVGVRDIDLRQLQRHLVEIGNLPDTVLTDDDNFPVGDEKIRWAVDEGLDSYEGLALCFAEADRARPLLRAAYDRADEPQAKLRIAMVLGLIGDGHGAQTLKSELACRDWDEGWNYKGMGQFGMSTSEVDGLAIALGACAGADAWPVLLEKVAALGDDPAFSHCRAVAEACEQLYTRWPNDQAAPALAAALGTPGLAGHAQMTIAAVQAALTEDPCENRVRSDALRELHLARALYRCGDCKGLGEQTLQAYAQDLRGHFSRHARAVLDEKGQKA